MPDSRPTGEETKFTASPANSMENPQALRLQKHWEDDSTGQRPHDP